MGGPDHLRAYLYLSPGFQFTFQPLYNKLGKPTCGTSEVFILLTIESHEIYLLLIHYGFYWPFHTFCFQLFIHKPQL